MATRAWLRNITMSVGRPLADYAVKLTKVADNLFLLSTATSNHIKTYMHLKEHTKESLT